MPSSEGPRSPPLDPLPDGASKIETGVENDKGTDVEENGVSIDAGEPVRSRDMPDAPDVAGARPRGRSSRPGCRKTSHEAGDDAASDGSPSAEDQDTEARTGRACLWAGTSWADAEELDSEIHDGLFPCTHPSMNPSWVDQWVLEAPEDERVLDGELAV